MIKHNVAPLCDGRKAQIVTQAVRTLLTERTTLRLFDFDLVDARLGCRSTAGLATGDGELRLHHYTECGSLRALRTTA